MPRRKASMEASRKIKKDASPAEPDGGSTDKFVKLDLPKKIFVKLKGPDGGFVQVELPAEVYAKRDSDSDGTDVDETIDKNYDEKGDNSETPEVDENFFIEDDDDEPQPGDANGDEVIGDLKDTNCDDWFKCVLMKKSPVKSQNAASQTPTDDVVDIKEEVFDIVAVDEAIPLDMETYEERIKKHRPHPVQCPECDKTLLGERRLKAHFDKLHSNIDPDADPARRAAPRQGKTPYKTCEICNRQTFSEKTYNKHMYKYHKIGEEIVVPEKRKKTAHMTCLVCQKGFPTALSHDYHAFYEHKIGERPRAFRTVRPNADGTYPDEYITCHICHKNCRRPGDLRQHLLSHGIGYKYTCEKCGKVFKNKIPLMDHMRTHTGERPFVCDVCDKTFITRNTMIMHKKRHGERNCICDECGLAFFTPIDVEKHRLRHSDARYFDCDSCSSRFKTRSAWSRHLQRHKQVNRDHKCDLCDMAFYDPIVLRQHRVTHTAQPENVCEQCGKQFLRPYNLRVHMRIHNGSRPYQCQFCDKAFTQLAGLKSHAKSHGHGHPVKAQPIESHSMINPNLLEVGRPNSHLPMVAQENVVQPDLYTNQPLEMCNQPFEQISAQPGLIHPGHSLKPLGTSLDMIVVQPTP